MAGHGAATMAIAAFVPGKVKPRGGSVNDRVPYGVISIHCGCCQLKHDLRDRDGPELTICDTCYQHRGQLPDKRLARAALTPRTALPHAEHIARGIAEGGDPQIALRIRWRHEFAAVRSDPLQCVVDAPDVDVRQHPSLARNGEIGHPMADDMPGAVLEARIISVAPHLPPEDCLVERGGLVRVLGGDAKVRDPAGSKYRVFVRFGRRHIAIVHHPPSWCHALQTAVHAGYGDCHRFVRSAGCEDLSGSRVDPASRRSTHGRDIGWRSRLARPDS